jgi:2-hydroxychromene-2-carboxylate isomerase
MASTVEFYLFYGSIHCYLTVMRIDALAAGSHVEVR